MGCFLIGCSSNQSSVDQGGDFIVTRDSGSDFLHQSDSSDECVADAAICRSDTRIARCEKTGEGIYRWVETSCADNERCFNQACRSECADECVYRVNGTKDDCKLYSIKNASFSELDDASLLHHRARLYDARLRNNHLPSGEVANAHYETAALEKIVGYSSVGDSALWTGAYLATESLRYLATDSKDAEENAERLVETIHRLFVINGHQGYLTRFAAPMDEPDPAVTRIYNPSDDRQRIVSYQGKDWFVWEDTSRDAYQGPLLGYAWAYQTLKSQTHRQMIRDDMIELCEAVTKRHQDLNVTIRINLFNNWVDIPTKMTLENIILVPSDFVNGKPFIQFGSEEDPQDYESSTLKGFREFMPDFSALTKQLPVIGDVLNFPIHRSSSAMMLATILRIGMLVTANDQSTMQLHQKYKTYYETHFAAWLDVMDDYLFLNAAKCWVKYYGLNISWMPMWTLVRLEDDPNRRTQLINRVLAGKMWPIVKDHKNVFFSFIYASQVTSAADRNDVIAAAIEQLKLFRHPPFDAIKVDTRDQYPVDANCPDQSTIATDVNDRPARDFIWQKRPFITYDAGEANKVYPGVGYLLTYWMARYEGWLTDDTAGSCLRPTSDS